MTIEEYFSNYKTNKKYSIKLSNGTDETINDFYNNCISLNLLPKENVIAWHKMLIEYANRQDAIYLIRYYEAGNKNSGRWNNRRGCLTRFADGFSYVFAGNFDAHEILNMIRLGVKPNVDEFARLMNNFDYPMHYDPGTDCEESSIAAYPNIGSPRGGILTYERWYLAHINDIKSEFIREDGSYRSIDINSDEGKRIYPRGNINDWKKVNEHIIRELPYSLTDEEKKLVKAHFLRFIDPLNYYVTPGPKYETNSVCTRIGEYKILNNYISKKFEDIYDSYNMDDFRREALIKEHQYNSTGSEIINITYGNIESNKIKTVVHKENVTTITNISELKIGQYAKNVFEDLLINGKIDSSMINNLLDKTYCSREFSICFPVLTVYTQGNVAPKRYYKELILDKYLICSEWYERSRVKINEWLKNN